MLLIEIAKAYPLATGMMVILPLVGGIAAGIVGAVTGYENLTTRLRNDQQIDRIEAGVKDLKLPVETIRRYESELRAAGQNAEILQRLIAQYDQLSAATGQFEKHAGRPDTNNRVKSAEHILNEMRAVIPTADLRPGPGGKVLILRTGLNTFRVTFAVPMRIAPSLDFPDLPAGLTPNVLEKSNIGFTVIFTPSSVPVEVMPHFSASARL